eukprot:gene13409-15793_t
MKSSQESSPKEAASLIDVVDEKQQQKEAAAAASTSATPKKKNNKMTSFIRKKVLHQSDNGVLSQSKLYQQQKMQNNSMINLNNSLTVPLSQPISASADSVTVKIGTPKKTTPQTSESYSSTSGGGSSNTSESDMTESDSESGSPLSESSELFNRPSLRFMAASTTQGASTISGLHSSVVIGSKVCHDWEVPPTSEFEAIKIEACANIEYILQQLSVSQKTLKEKTKSIYRPEDDMELEIFEKKCKIRHDLSVLHEMLKRFNFDHIDMDVEFDTTIGDEMERKTFLLARKILCLKMEIGKSISTKRAHILNTIIGAVHNYLQTGVVPSEVPSIPIEMTITMGQGSGIGQQIGGSIYKKGSLSKRKDRAIGTKFSSKWVVLSHSELFIYSTEKEEHCLHKKHLNELSLLSLTPKEGYPYCFTMLFAEGEQGTEMDQEWRTASTSSSKKTKSLVLACDSQDELVQWVLAVDGVLHSSFRSVMDLSAKESLLATYRIAYKGGMFRFGDEEWHYLDGRLTNETWGDVLEYSWDGYKLVPAANSKMTLGHGRWNGVWMTWYGSDDRNPYLKYLYQPMHRNYIVDCYPVRAQFTWTWSRHFLVSASGVTRGKPVFVNADPKGNNLLYACGNAIIIRDIKDACQADLYYEHPAATTTARYSPSGFYIASGDVQGNVRIWDTTSKEHPLKITLKLLAGAILDLCWSADSQRIIAVGDGRERFGAAVLWDSGASVGEITGHSKIITSCDIKSSRPFRAATGSEDCAVNWFEGPPFKYNKALAANHQRFVNCVRFSPDGSKVISVSSDKTGVIFDGKTGDKLIDLQGGHNGGIYCASWSADNNRVLTASADKTCKIWDSTTGTCLTTFTFGTETSDQQLGCLWVGDNLISINLEGEISFLDAGNPSAPSKVIRGHNKLIASLAYDPETKALFSASYDATLLKWNVSTGLAAPFTGVGHKNQITAIKIRGDDIITIAMDDSIKISKISTSTYGPSIAIDSPGTGIAFNGDVIVACSMKSVYVIKGGKIVSTTAAPYEPLSISFNGKEVAVGGKDNKVHIYTISGDSLTAAHTLEEHRGQVTEVVYSPCGKYLASGCSNREIIVWEGKNKKNPSWVNHSARINSIVWTSDSHHLISGGLDSSIFVWDLQKAGSPIQVRNSHPGGINEIVTITDDQIATCGNDGAIKMWTIAFKA